MTDIPNRTSIDVDTDVRMVQPFLTSKRYPGCIVSFLQQSAYINPGICRQVKLVT